PEFLVSCVDVFGEYPVNGRFERSLLLSKENCDVATRHGSNLFVGVEPSDLKSERITVVLLSELDVGYRQLGHGMTDGVQLGFCAHGAFLYAAESATSQSRSHAVPSMRIPDTGSNGFSCTNRGAGVLIKY